jgi:glycosyltransferase involved in cell wall biosynthesis
VAARQEHVDGYGSGPVCRHILELERTRSLFTKMSLTPESVLMVTPRWARDGGVAAHVKESASALVQYGLRVEVLVARVEDDASLPGVTVHRSPTLFNASTSMVARLGPASSLHADVVHLHQVADPEIMAAMRKRAPVVISAHAYPACTSGVYYFAPGEECTRPHGPGCVPNLVARGCAHTRHPRRLPSGYRRATRAVAAFRLADMAFTYSSAVDRHLAANGVARRKVIPLFTTIAPKMGTGHSGRRRVVFAGRIEAPKGVGILIRAAASVDAEFVICGDGRKLDAMRRLARRLGVEKRVCFTGWLSAEALAEELANASVVVMPSLWPEPFGLVGIEALACGRPVVASSTGGILDWLEDGVTGLCVKPGDAPELARALTELLADPARQRTMGLAGRKAVAARFSPQRHCAALVDGYQTARSTWQAERRGVRGEGQGQR